ncbi:MAG TPA: ATP-binding protein [Thermoanaerobaculia bacterium]|nr:ATP-binding protein [Thermoanaerobaculia bacterium]
MKPMQELVDAFDWAATPIGPRDSWPQSLRTSVSICLASRFPILVWWGPDLTKIYNDAYAPILGDKHPRALGARGRDVWPEIWPVIGPMLDQVRFQGKATWSDDQLLMMRRHGYLEETYFTFSYSPILDESGGVGGIFTAVSETTTRVVGKRRLDTLRRLAARAGEANTVEEACLNAAEILGANPSDIPFAALYLGGRQLCAVGTASLPQTLDLGTPPAIEGAMTLPLHVPGGEDTAALLVAGVSPHRPLDDDYRGFFSLAAGHIASAIAKARAYEMERERAEALAELDRAKTAFFSNVSHEFRTPLTLMLGPIEDILAHGAIDGSTREHLEVAQRNALRLLKLVNALLDFSRLEAGRIEAAYEPVDLAALTTELVAVFRSAVERAGLRLIVNCEALGEPVYVDREMWEKLVFNLLSNAFKFTMEGEIVVTLRRVEGRAELSVRDTGTGIPADELPRVFDRFHRVKGARGRTYEGSGIGLALVHELAKLHGGSVSATSEVDRGSTFTVSIPLGKAHLPADRITGTREIASRTLRSDAYVEEALRWLPDAGMAPPYSAPGTQRSAHVLLADDNADMRDYIRRLLGDTYEVEAVSDGHAALEAALRRKPDLVLTDVMMPGMDGFELLRALRADERTREVPVILLSARAGEESRVEGLQSGADDYLVKPFGARELIARVDAHLRLAEVRREAQTALRESEAKFATAFDRSPLALLITSLDDGRLVEVNEGFVLLSGYTREEVIGRSPDELGLWVDPQIRAERFQRLHSGQPVPDIEARFRIRSGEELIGFIGSALVDINGKACVLSSIIDITERKRAEEALRTSEARFREFANTAPAMLFITEPDGRCSFLSRGWYEFTGQTEAQALGFGWIAAVHPDDVENVRATFLGANERREPFAVDYRIRRANGEYAWAIDSGRPRFGSNGEFLGYVGSVIDITERKHAEQAKDEFLATLSHELRTPLTSGFGWVKLLGKARDPEILETGLHAIEESLVNQMKLIDDLLDVSRIAAGKMHLEVQPLDVGSVVDGAVEMVRPAAEAKGVAVRIHAQAALSVRGDAARLKQVFWNLLSNAIKFTPAGGRVDVELRASGGSAEVVVRDTGQGIDPKFLPHVFARFRQADASTTRKHGGLGIGLAIVASLVDAHGGTVHAASKGLDQGATFTVKLPLIEQPATRPALSEARGQANLAGARILIVDDDAGARRVMMAALEAAGAEVRECRTAGEAWDAISQWRPDVLISDLAMPNEDGYSLISRLRETGNLLPALALTAYVRPEDETRVRNAGFQRHVAKPFDPEELVQAVGELARTC